MYNNKKEDINLFWFKRDLRMHDHGPLETWQRLSNSPDQNTPKGLGLYVVENGYWMSEKASSSQKEFVLQCAITLKDGLNKIGGSLLIIEENSAKEAIELLTKLFNIKEIICHRETGNKWTFDRDLAVKRFSQALGIKLTEIAQDSLVRASKTKITDFSDRYYNFVNSRQFIIPVKLKSVDTSSAQTALASKLINLKRGQETSNVLIQPGGEEEAVKNLLSFLDQRCLGSKGGYRKEMSSPLTANIACSRISAHLSWGSISARASYQTATQALQSLSFSDPRVKHIQSFITRLAWRTHFMQKFETLHWMEFKCLNPKSEDLHSWNQEALDVWKNGMTGYPFVDACMRSLAQTKWLNFRARAMVVSFASYALNLDWRQFGPYLAQTFLDYEPGIHYSQLQMQGGTTLGSPPRIYSPLKQSVEKDPTGEFIRLWVPELRDCSDSLIHLPSDYPRHGYPPTVVDHTRLWAIMRGNAPKSPEQRRSNFKTIKKKITTATKSSRHKDSQLEFSLETLTKGS